MVLKGELLITSVICYRQCRVAGTAQRIAAAVRNGSAIRLFVQSSSCALQNGSKCPTTHVLRCAYRRHGGTLFVAFRVRLHSATLRVGTAHHRREQKLRLIRLESAWKRLTFFWHKCYLMSIFWNLARARFSDWFRTIYKVASTGWSIYIRRVPS